MSWQLFISAFGLGLLSSFHCVGMCGAIAFSLPTQRCSKAGKLSGILLYNLGRISIYVVIGLLFGLAGRQVYIAGWQQWFSILAGGLMVLFVLQSVVRQPLFRVVHFNRFNLFIQNLIGRFLIAAKVQHMLLLGLANGLLPCGLVYFALAGALATGSATSAALFMAAFGAGTLPAMFVISFFGVSFSLPVRQKMKAAMPYALTAMGMLLILRGMGLGIPYISPLIPHHAQVGEVIGCH